ncbi:carbohydrate-binding protein [Micromonospora coxensis]|uniref:Carbohydrate binding module (Family 6) n=1 Tax=Micromonospora coxensis TaxID=356852 RepID=A0A1C5GUJ5_9ACTN|nr:carbohydrate-binding protein [Micromonospora coxensis]SCG37456.1 Carbohydrate binding module (family 6) [Micromonospora coxensis]
MTGQPAQAAPPALDFGCERIAWSSDGNYHDRDDIGASAMALALLAERGQQSRLVHWDYNSHLGSSTASWERDMVTATEGVGGRFGYDVAGIFRNSQTNLNAAVTHLRSAVDASTATNQLCLVGAGPMGVVYRALQGSNSAARQHVTLISHSDWNNNHDDDDNRWNLADIRRDFPQVKYKRIPDQNAGLGTGGGEAKWSWMADNSDQRLRYVHNVVNNIMNKKGDVSDAGMMYYLITGDDSGNANKLRTFLTAPGGGTSPQTVQGESFTSNSGVQVAFHAPAQGGATAGYVNDGDWAGYAQVSTAGRTQFSARVASGTSGGTIEVRSGSPTGELLGSVDVPATGGWTTYRTVSTSLSGTGTGPLHLVFTGGAGFLLDVDSFTVS